MDEPPSITVVRALFGFVSALLLLPARILEESIHAAAAWPWAESVSVSVGPTSRARTRVRYRADAPGWAVRLAHVAPELVASVAGLAVLAWWVVAGPVWWPSTTADWALLWALGANYVALVAPEEGAVGGGADG